MPMRRRAALMSVFGCRRSIPSTKIEPSVGSSRRFRQRRNVLLPAPDGPMMNTSSWGSTAKSIPLRTSVPPKVLRSPRTSRIRLGCADIMSGKFPGVGPAHIGEIRHAAAPYCEGASRTRRSVLRRIIARHVRHAVAGVDRGRGRAWRRLGAEPLLVHLGHCAVPLHAFDGQVELAAQLDVVLAHRRSPN